MVEKIKRLIDERGGREKVYRFITAPWIANNSFYNLLYQRRIKKIMKRGSEFPSVIAIETTNFCNARCIMCAYRIMKRKKGFMSIKLYRKIIEEIKDRELDILLLSGFGEPLIDKRLPDFIKYAKDKGIKKIGIVTNGSLLFLETAQKLADAGLDEIHISIDGADKHTFEKIRIGLSFERVVENIENLRTLKNKPHIILQMVVIRENEKQIKEFLKKFKNSADRIIIRQAQNWIGSISLDTQSFSPHIKQLKVSYPPCHYLWTSLSIYWDGTVPLCCLDYDAKVILGNVNVESVEEIWKKEKFNRIRTLHIARKREKIPLCKNCTYYSVWW